MQRGTTWASTISSSLTTSGGRGSKDFCVSCRGISEARSLFCWMIPPLTKGNHSETCFGNIPACASSIFPPTVIYQPDPSKSKFSTTITLLPTERDGAYSSQCSSGETVNPW